MISPDCVLTVPPQQLPDEDLGRMQLEIADMLQLVRAVVAPHRLLDPAFRLGMCAPFARMKLF